MNLNFSEEELQFQQEVRQFLADKLPQHIVDGTANNGSVFVEKDIALEWQAILVKQGWAVPQWPVEHGISFLLIDMNTAGVTVEPIITMAGDHEVNQVFFDNVRVPMANRIGEENQGWSYAKYLLEFERGGGFSAHRIRHELGNLRRLMNEARQGNADFDNNGDIDRQVARLEIDLKALEITELRILSSVSGGGNPGPESSIMKLTATRLEQAINELSVDVLGYTGFIMNPVAHGNPVRADYTSSVVPRYLNNRAASIFGGSQEVQRNIIAKMVLGL
jgi:acyl-CoA dehydrogenase